MRSIFATSAKQGACSVPLLLTVFVIILCGGWKSVYCQGEATENAKLPVDNIPLPPSPNKDTTQPPSTSLTTDPLQNILVISTLDGTLTALDRVSGEIRWISHDKPMIQVPSTTPNPTPSPDSTHNNNSKPPKAPYFLPDPKTGSLYMMGKQNSLRKLPFTIPQLVAMAPCKNSEGLMYTGRKLDMWLSLNPYTGEKYEMPMDGGSETCPKWSATVAMPPHYHNDPHCPTDESNKHSFTKPVLIGKTEYTLSMMDGPRKWNVTYHHYSSNDMSSQSLQDYEQVHFTSPSEGHLMTYDRSGELLWQVELTSPVVGLYTIDGPSTNLVSVPFNPIASDTLERLKGGQSASTSKALSPTTYVGECAYGIYAVPALADEHVLVIGEGGSLPLLEGPEMPGASKFFKGSTGSGDGDYLLLGYYQVESAEQQGSGSSSPPQLEGGKGTSEDLTIQFNESKVIPVPPKSTQNPTRPQQNQQQQQKQESPHAPPDSTPVRFPPPPTSSKKEIKIVFTTAVISTAIASTIFVIIFFAYRRHKNNQLEMQHKLLSNDSGASGERRSNGSGITSYIDTSTGELTVGKITLFPTQVLGKGCEGTFVFKGKFEGRDVAVKRILPECFSLADREVDLLKESDQHVNVIRYFCTESDGQFRYIALELCLATLSDWVEGRWDSGVLDICGVDVLNEATEGLGYLHSLRIVHRDVKPANVLLSLGGGLGKVRTMISDFGLCKKIRDGRGSYSRRSGGVPGTDGWIAPEVVCGMGGGDGPSGRMTYSVDIFSMGCVFYYVLTKGQHPFGDPFRRQSNIITGEYELSLISDNPRGAYNLVRAMISTEAEERPPLRAILTHPFFWSNEKVLSFFLDVSDRIEKETEDSFPLLRKLESGAFEIVKGDWRDHICGHVAMDLRKYRTYKGDNLRDLLRALRNKKNHYRELTTEAQESLGVVPDGFVAYWVGRFPSLLEYVWNVFEGVKKDAGFSRYYSNEFDWGSGSDLFEFDQAFGGDNSMSRGNELSNKKLGKDFWRSKSQAKYQRWRGSSRGRGSPQRRVVIVNEDTRPRDNNGELSASTDNYWRGRSPGDNEGKENKVPGAGGGE